MMTLEKLQQYVTTLVENGLLRPLSTTKREAIELLFQDGLIVSTQEGDLTPQSSRYIYIVCCHDQPLGAEHLLGTLECFGLLSEDYPLSEANFVAVTQTNYPEEIASVLDRIYSRDITPGAAQEYLEKLQRMTIGESESVEKSFALLQVRILQRMFSPTWCVGEFEDELQIALNSMNASRENPAALVFDPESAIQPLTPSEERRLKKAIEYYAPKIEQKGGVEACYTSLLKALEARYNQNPMYLSIGSIDETAPTLLSRFSLHGGAVKKISFRLPLKWEEFQMLPLTQASRERALLLYCANTVHTAYRFFKDLDAPSPWLASPKYWESFARYKTTLAMLWLAVNDESMPPVSDYTLEGRVDYFINSFAEFRRDKNSEGRRESSRQPGKYEYYDDGELDKPGCSLGFRDRAYDAVKGHPLFERLTPQVLHKEIQKRSLHYFSKTLKNKIKTDVLVQIHQSWANVLAAEPGDQEMQTHLLAKLNIPKSLQNAWLNTLKSQYVDLAEDGDLVTKYEEFFSLSDIFPTHAHRFGSTRLESILEKEMASRKIKEEEIKDDAEAQHNSFLPG